MIDLPEFARKDWKDAPAGYIPGLSPRPVGATDIDQAALEDLEQRHADYTKAVGEALAEPLGDLAERIAALESGGSTTPAVVDGGGPTSPSTGTNLDGGTP